MFFEETQLSKKELKDKLDYYKKVLDNKYNRANSMSKINRIAIDLCNFSDLYKNLLGYNIDTCWMHDDMIIEMAIYDDMKSTNSFINHIIKNNEFYDKLSGNIISVYKNNKFPFYNKYNKYVENMRKITDDDMFDIVCSFLNSYDEKLCNEFLRKLDDLEIFSLNTFGLSDFDGLTTNIASINKNFIMLDISQGRNINYVKTLLHELGHSFEYKIQNATNMSLKTFDTPFYEISSSFFEYAFLKHLEDNNIYNEDVSNCLNTYFREIFSYVFDVKLISKMKSFSVDENKDIGLIDNKISSYGEKIKKDVNFYQLPGYSSNSNLVSSYIYSLGMIFSIYLYDVYKSDPNNFKINFSKSLCEYPLTKDIFAFEKTGIKKEELLNAETFNKVLRKHLDNLN